MRLVVQNHRQSNSRIAMLRFCMLVQCTRKDSSGTIFRAYWWLYKMNTASIRRFFWKSKSYLPSRSSGRRWCPCGGTNDDRRRARWVGPGYWFQMKATINEFDIHLIELIHLETLINHMTGQICHYDVINFVLLSGAVATNTKSMTS